MRESAVFCIGLQMLQKFILPILHQKFTYITAVHDAAVAALSMHACELARRHGERHSCRHPLFCRQLTDWVETSVLLLMRQLPQQHSTAARSAAAAHIRLILLHADWLAGGPGDYKSERRQYVCSLVGGGPGRRHDRLGTRRIKDL